MSAARLEEYISDNFSDSQSEIREERTRILEMASQKAKEKTLTLKETTDLYEKFNHTFDENFKSAKRAQKDDESWALKLLEEAEEEHNHSLETRINGVPLNFKNECTTNQKSQPSRIIKQKIYQEELKPAPLINKEDMVREKSKFIDFFIYDQFSLNHDAEDLEEIRKTTNPAFRVVSLTVFISALVVLGAYLF